MVNGALFLFGNERSRSKNWLKEAMLPRGRYLVKVYFDASDRVSNDAAALLTKSDFQGEVEIEKARWRPGFRFAQVIDGSSLAGPVDDPE